MTWLLYTLDDLFPPVYQDGVLKHTARAGPGRTVTCEASVALLGDYSAGFAR